jgi:hypothetical protein
LVKYGERENFFAVTHSNSDCNADPNLTTESDPN